LGLLILDLVVVALADPTFGLPRWVRRLSEKDVPRGLVALFGLRLALLLASAGAAATVVLMGAGGHFFWSRRSCRARSEALGRILFYATFRKAGL